MLTLIAFITALGLLITVHEYGHYRVAVACGVRVLRFSVGFGRVIYRWKPRRQRPGQDTEFVIGLLPLGGYVRMLDEREGPVAAQDRPRAFNTQPLRARAAIVAAGPLANLLTAALLYALVSWIGVDEPRPVLAPPVAGSVAERAGLAGGEWVQRAGIDGEGREPVVSFEALRWLLTRAALDGQDVVVEVGRTPSSSTREVHLPLSTLDRSDTDVQLLRRIGLLAPLSRPLLGDLTPGAPAERAGLRKGDLVTRVGDTPVTDASQLRERIRNSVAGGQAVPMRLVIDRSGQSLTVEVLPELRREGDLLIGRIGAMVGERPEMIVVRQDALGGLWRGVERVAEVSALSLRMLWRMLVGEASVKNLSGPLTIADYAGRSASLGLTQYLSFLALISVSLGVLNLLPIPVLDGGHLMYYLWEAATGRSISDLWMERLQRSGMAVLLLLMGIALFNDVTRLLG